MNKLGRRLLDDAKYQGSMPCVFRQEDFFMFFLYKPLDVKHVTPRVGLF